MNSTIQREYARLRKLGYPASNAWRAAKVRARFDGEPCVRLVGETDLLDLDVSWCETERELAELIDRANRDGVWMWRAEYLDPVDGWTSAWDCSGFIGDDFDDSGYDVDAREAALEALDALELPLVEGWV